MSVTFSARTRSTTPSVQKPVPPPTSTTCGSAALRASELGEGGAAEALGAGRFLGGLGRGRPQMSGGRAPASTLAPRGGGPCGGCASWQRP
jgi:hypothetical protein